MIPTTVSVSRSPSSAGTWRFRRGPDQHWQTVTVEENASSGRFCRELKMGGAAQCGFSDWSGDWIPEA